MDVQLQVALIGVVASVITSIIGQVAGYLLILRWVIRRQVDGAWVLRVDHDARVADLTRQIDAEHVVAVEWHETADVERNGRLEVTGLLDKALDAAKVSDRLWELYVAPNLGKVPQKGDNRQEEVASK